MESPRQAGRRGTRRRAARRPAWLLTAALAWLVVSHAPARAQQSPSSPTYTETIPEYPEQHLPAPRDPVPDSPGRLQSPGGFKFIPRVGVEFAADSNINYSSDPVADLSTTYGAGFTAGYEDYLGRKRYPELRRGYFLVSLDGARELFQEHSEFDNTNWLATASGGFLTPHGWSASFRDRLSGSSNATGESNDYGLGMPGLNRLSNILEGRSEYEFAHRWSAEVGVRHYYLDYAAFSSAWQNRDDLEGWTALLWRALPKTQALLEVRRKRTYFPDQQDQADNSMGLDAATSLDSVSTALFTGVRFSPLARVTGEAKVGVMKMDFDNPATRDALPLEDVRRWAMQADLAWHLTDEDAVTLLASRTLQETPDLQYQFREETGARLRLWRALSHSLEAEASAGFYRYDYEPLGEGDAREDDLLKGHLGLKYLFRSWSSVGVYYTCDKRLSSMEDEDYLKHLLEVRFGLEY